MKTTEQTNRDTDTVTITEPLPDYWARHLQRWRQTGQSQRAYCRDQNLSYYRFTYWRRKLQPEAASAQPAQGQSRSGFVPVTACSPSTAPGAGLTATLPNGVLLQGITRDNLDIVKPLLGLPS